MNNLRTFLEKVLEAIEYKNDKLKFITEFEKNIQSLYLLDLIDSLPDDKNQELTKQLTETENNQDNIKTLLNNFFTPDQIRKSIENTTTNTINEYIQTIAPTLTEPQLDHLESVFKEFEKPAVNQSS